MRNRVLLATVLFVSNACEAHAEEKIKATMSNASFRVEVMWVEGREKLREIVKRYGADAWSVSYANGFSVLVKVNGELVCRLFVREPKRVDDEATTVLGHELMHCIAGAYHE